MKDTLTPEPLAPDQPAADQPKRFAPLRSRTSRRMTVIGSAAFAILVAVLGANYIVYSNAATKSGLPWNSGVSTANTYYCAGDAEKFGTWRGRPVDVEVVWQGRTHWADLENADISNACKNRAQTMVWGIPPIPEDGSTSMAACAAGQANEHWKTIARNMVNNGYGNSIVRLGWEFNGNWYKWGGGNPATFAQCWNQIVPAAKSVAPNLKWDWTVNRGVTVGINDAKLAWPNNAYVDYVGVDSYHWWADWNTQLNGEQGLNYWLKWAKDHGKKLSIPEWGGAATAPGTQGDQAFYITNMFNFFKANAADIAYESYFEESDSYISSALYNPNQLPNMSAQYLALWRAGAGTVAPTPTKTATPTPTGVKTPTPTPSNGQISQVGNLVNGKTFTSSVGNSTVEPGNLPSFVNDGNETSRWISLPQDNVTLSTDLGNTYKLSKVSILWAGDTVKDYDIQMSPNNSTWTTIASGTTGNKSPQLLDTTSFTSSNGRYFRILAKNRWNTAYGNSIWEIGVYGAASTTPTVAPSATPRPTPTPTPSGTPKPTAAPTPSPIPSATGLRASYYTGSWFEGTSVSRVDPTINFNWGSGSPVAGVPTDYFSTRWTGQIIAPTTGTYTFTTNADDGVRLWVDNKLLVNSWKNQSATDHSGTVTLTAGQAVNIRMDYYEWAYSASAKLFWSGPSITKQIVPASALRPTVQQGLSATYINALTDAIYASLIEPTIDHMWVKAAPVAGAPTDWFATRWVGKIKAPTTGSYTFTTKSDDGVRLWVNGVQLVNDWNRHGLTNDSGTLTLTAGKQYDIKLEYYDEAEDATIKLLWQGPSVPQAIIPASAFTVN